MRLATPSGSVTVFRRNPLQGLDHPRRYGNGRDLLRFVNGPGGLDNVKRYADVYRCNPWVYAAVQAYARGVARLTLKTYALQADGTRERVRGDLPGVVGAPSAGARLDKLMTYPEPGMSAFTWWRQVVRDRFIFGNALVVKERDANGMPTALRYVDWQDVSVEAERLLVLFYEVMGDKDSERFSPLDVVHFGRGTDSGTPVGLSPLKPLQATLALHDALWRHAVAYMENQARPSGNLKLEKGADKQVIELIREQIRELYTSPENAGKVLVTTGSFESITDSPDQSSLVELAKLSREEIAAAYAIPQPLLGILDKAILNNTKELRSFWTRDTIGPVADEFEEDLMAQLVNEEPVWRGIVQEFDLWEMMRPDPEALADMAQKMRHVLTPDEMRGDWLAKAPLDKPGSDTVWMPAGQQGLGIPAPAPAPAPAPSTKEPEAKSEPTEATARPRGWED